MNSGTSYVSRKINLTFQLGEGTFGESGTDQMKLTGLRVVTHIELPLGSSTGMAQIYVYGLSLDPHINKLSKAGLLYKAKPNYVLVEAGDDKFGMSTVFNGAIYEAYPSMRGAPAAAFVILANPAYVIQLKPSGPNTFKGATSAATALETIIKPAGLTLKNDGVTAVLASPYFAGSVWDQIVSLTRAANCFFHYDGITKTLIIWPKDGKGSGGGTTTISPETGMIGYPEFQAVNMTVRVIYNPQIELRMNQKVKVVSELKAANGEFNITNVAYDLASEMPGGPWEIVLNLTAPGAGA